MITYYLYKKKIFKGFEPLLVYPMALDFLIIVCVIGAILNLIYDK